MKTTLSPGGQHIVDPLLIMFEDDTGDMQCHVYPHDYPPEVFGMLLCDAARNIAKAFGVEEQVIFELFDKERQTPTTQYWGAP